MKNSNDHRTGAELLLDKYIEATICESPLAFPQLRKAIYDGLEKVIVNSLNQHTAISFKDLSPEEVTAYSILEKTGLINMTNIQGERDYCIPTEHGFAVYDSLGRDGVYKTPRLESADKPENLVLERPAE